MPTNEALRPGMMIFHNGIPVELLYKVKSSEKDSVDWKCELLFVQKPNIVLRFPKNGVYSKLHTQFATRSGRG